MPCPPSNKLTVIGAGIVDGDRSERLQRCLDESTQLFCIEPMSRFRTRYPGHAHKCRSLDAVFDELGDQRSAALYRIAELVIEGCRSHANAALILGGHPCLAVKPVQHLLESRPKWLTIDIVPGVSSIDWMMADLGIDAAETGLQIVTASRSDCLSSKLPAAIMSPGYAQSVGHADRLSALAVLAKDLIACYGQDAVFIIYTRRDDGYQTDKREVSDLVALAGERHLGDKLLLGPLSLLPARP